MAKQVFSWRGSIESKGSKQQIKVPLIKTCHLHFLFGNQQCSVISIWASLCEKGTSNYHIGKLQRLSWACTAMQSRQNLCCLHTTWGPEYKKFQTKNHPWPYLSGCACMFEGSQTTKCLGSCFHEMAHLFEPPHDKTNKMTAPNEDSDQPGHAPSLIRVFAVRSMGS